ncbi:MAG: DUF2156 domain-containing protein [Spirochaetota bacterium]
MNITAHIATYPELTFVSLYLFRETYSYRISRLPDGLLLVLGRDRAGPFFMLPLGLPDPPLLERLFDEHRSMKAVSERQAGGLRALGYAVAEDRDNFDYLYEREELAVLRGNKYHRKKNLVNQFTRSYRYEGRPLTGERIPGALRVLEQWREEHRKPADYQAAREGLEKSEELALCGGIYYVSGEPAAYSMGEELGGGRMFAVHFEKALGRYRGLYQFINQSFASLLPARYALINREQDLGDPGLRKAKMSYRPAGFVKKYRAFAEAPGTAGSAERGGG